MATDLYPKWMYRVDPYSGAFQNTLVASAEVAEQLVKEGEAQGAAWTDDPHGHGADVVPYPAELTPAGTLIHNPSRPDENGNHAHGPAPTAIGINGTVVVQPQIAAAMAELAALKAENAALKAGKGVA